MNINNRHVSLVTIVYGANPQNPFELQLVTWVKGPFSQIEPFTVRSVSAGNKSFILDGYDPNIRRHWFDQNVLRYAFEPLVGTVFAKAIRNNFGTENLVDVTKNTDLWKTCLALVPASILGEIKTNFEFSGFDLTTHQELLALKARQQKENVRDLRKARRGNIPEGLKLKITGIFKISDVPKRDFELAIKAFKIFGKLMEEKKKLLEMHQRTVRYN